MKGLLLLTLLTPLAFALGILLLQGRGREGASRGLALAGSIVAFLFSLILIFNDFKAAEYAVLIDASWVPRWGIRFILGMDGLSSAMVLLTNLLVIISILASWTAIETRRKEFYAFLLILQTGIIGAFLSLDLFLFYIFWELMLIPLYFLIGIFGSSNRLYAAMKFFLYTMAGSVLMLVGILVLHFAGSKVLGHPTFAISELIKATASSEFPAGIRSALFLSFFIAFAIKVPLFPFHTWLPDAHTEAPTAGSILLAGVLLKTGVYGLMRFAIPLFPAEAQHFAPLFMTLAVIAIIYGALAAYAQEDMKRLVAYSSVSHMGFIVLGLFSGSPEATGGAAIQMINHGISTGALFFCVGVLYERRHTRALSEFGGLARVMKLYTIMTIIAVLSSAALPGMNGFVGEFLILLGTFQTQPVLATFASLGVILAAAYLLRMVQKTFFGPITNEKNKTLSDVNFREGFALAILLFMAVWMGLKPGPWLKLVEPTTAKTAASMAVAKVEAVAAVNNAKP